MARFAPVASPALLRYLVDEYPYGEIGGYHLMVANEVAKDPEAYHDVAKYIRQVYSKSWIILDNGAYEEGKPVDIGMMREAVETVKPDVVAAPDVIGNCERTIDIFLRRFTEWSSLGVPLMAILHGTSLYEIRRCLYVMLREKEVKHIGIPRVIADTMGSRVPTVQQALQHIGSKKYGIHLLGFSKNLQDDITAARNPFVMGIDSTEPLRLGLELKKMNFRKPVSPGPRSEDYFGHFEASKEQVEVIVDNIEWVNNAIAMPDMDG